MVCNPHKSNLNSFILFKIGYHAVIVNNIKGCVNKFGVYYAVKVNEFPYLDYCYQRYGIDHDHSADHGLICSDGRRCLLYMGGSTDGYYVMNTYRSMLISGGIHLSFFS
jgi:hypothetical protein